MPFIGAVSIQGIGGDVTLTKGSGLLEDVRLKTMKQPSTLPQQLKQGVRLANAGSNRYSGAQAMSLTRG